MHTTRPRNSLLMLALFLQLQGCALSGITISAENPIRESVRCSNPTAPGVDIYLINLGWHTGIAVPRSAATPEIKAVVPELRQYRWVEFGWGDRDFYMSEDDTVWGAIRALFFSSGSVVHVVGFEESPTKFFENHHVFRIRLSQAGTKDLLEFLSDSIRRNAQGEARRFGSGLYGNSSFYDATAGFSINKTCNTWTAEALKAAGCPIDSGIRKASSLAEQVNSLPELHAGEGS